MRQLTEPICPVLKSPETNAETGHTHLILPVLFPRVQIEGVGVIRCVDLQHLKVPPSRDVHQSVHGERLPPQVPCYLQRPSVTLKTSTTNRLPR